jgi:DNA-binding NtrC family response regulator
MRAAELHALVGQLREAHAEVLAALSMAPDALARRDFWRRLELLLEGPLGADGRRIAGYADHALELGDIEPALSLARRAASVDPSSAVHMRYEIALTLGRATRRRGDLSQAAAALREAQASARDAAERARADAELAEVALTEGERERARELAESASRDASDDATRIAASNVHGKLLLAEGGWHEAERHFAADESNALCAGRASDALRARVNRAIAVMSNGQRGEARALFASVLAEGEESGDRRACAMALANLATLAILSRDEGEALLLQERAIDEMRAIGDASSLARQILNLAELRLRLGMVSEAEQALAFARQACPPSVLGAQAALLAFVRARVRFAAGNTVQAASDVEEAIVQCARGSSGAKLGECHRLAARIALDDGDLARAEAHLEGARQAPAGPGAAAELALIEIELLRALGEPYREQCKKAVALAMELGDGELCCRAQLLSSYAADSEGDREAAERHARAALRLRDKLAAALPEARRPQYLARRDLVEIADLERRSAPASESARLEPLRRDARRELVGRSRAMEALYTAVAKVAASDATVLIAGESGTGKELVATALHRLSRRAAGPLVKINCGALCESLLLSELFGHEKGAFTGAHSKKRGHFEQADGGTIFLDEIGDISPKTQVALLRVLQERTIERVGGSSPVAVDVRIVCATHRDLRQMVDDGSFREDLYYRLCGVSLEVPALRQRLEDVPLVAAALLERIAGEVGGRVKRLSDDAIDALQRHRWPGNVRELENALRAAALFTEGDVITLRDVTEHVASLRHLVSRPSEPQSVPPPSHTRTRVSTTEVAYAEVKTGTSLPELKRMVEKACIERALEEAGGNITRAAQLLGMKRPRLSQLVNQYGRDDDPAGRDSEAEVMP